MANKLPALLVIDVQNAFCPGGILAVPNRDLEQVIKLLNLAMRFFFRNDWPIFASIYCKTSAIGAKFRQDLEMPKGVHIIKKGINGFRDGLSAFDGYIFLSDCSFEEMLREQGITDLYMGGIGTNIGIRKSALDSKRNGHNTFLLRDACWAIHTDESTALKEMRQAGITFTTTDELIRYPVRRR